MLLLNSMIIASSWIFFIHMYLVIFLTFHLSTCQSSFPPSCWICHVNNSTTSNSLCLVFLLQKASSECMCDLFSANKNHEFPKPLYTSWVRDHVLSQCYLSVPGRLLLVIAEILQIAKMWYSKKCGYYATSDRVTCLTNADTEVYLFHFQIKIFRSRAHPFEF